MNTLMILAAVRRTRRALTQVVYARSTLLACGVALSAWLVVDGVAFVRGGASGLAGAVGPVGAVMALALALLVASLVARRRARRLTDVDVALWIEEREVGAQPVSFALVTLVEALQRLPASYRDPTHPFVAAAGEPMVDASTRAIVESARLQASARTVLGQTNVAHALTRSARQQLVGPSLFVVGALSVLGAGAVARSREAGTRYSAAPAGRADGATSLPVPVLGAWQVRVEAPAYMRRAPHELGDVSNVAAVSGSTVQVRGTGPLPDEVIERVVGESADTLPADRRQRRLASVMARDGWQVRTVATDGPVTLQLSRGGRARLLVVEGRADSLPIVSLLQPARDSVFRTPDGSLTLEAAVRDDLGLSKASFELIISSGEGERFTARTLQMGARTFAGDRTGTVRARVDLGALKLVGGDIVHLRAVARDAHPASRREFGSSETRSFRIARLTEYDSVAVEPAPPPEVDKSLLSQRMLLMLTEKLDRQRRTLDRATVLNESVRIARDQARLRQAVGDVVFQRLSGTASGEHAHSVGDGHDHGVEQQQGKLALTGGNVGGVLEEGDDSPIIAINQPLLEAYNAMWDAGRALEQGAPRDAIPHMRLALAAIERARSAERLYLRGKPPTVIIDLAKVRLSGKDTGQTNLRRAREMLPSRTARRSARLIDAAQLLTTDARAAQDSLAVLRVEALADAPAFATAVGAVLDVLDRHGDVTAAFLRARRVLGGVARTDAGTWSRSVPR